MAPAFTFVSCAVYLALALSAAIRGRRDPIAVPFALLSLALFVYQSTELVRPYSHAEFWPWLNTAAAALAVPFTTDFLLAFVGRRYRLRLIVVAAYVLFGVLALSSLAPIALPSLRWFPNSAPWAATFIALLIPFTAICVVELIRHASRERGFERRRAELAIAALVVLAGGSMTDLVAIAGADGMPLLSPVGLLGSALLFAAIALRLKLFEVMTFLLVVAAVFTAIVVELALFVALGSRPAVLVIPTLALLVLAGVVVRHLVRAQVEWRTRIEYLSTLGRLAAQMAHDVRNPVAAIRGATEFLVGEIRAGRSIDKHIEFLDLIHAQTERLTTVVANYQRLGRAEPQRRTVDVREVIERASSARRVADPKQEITVNVEVSDQVAPISADPDLLSTALENLLRNAAEAMDGKGAITVTAGIVDASSDLAISVRDTGPGMDPRVRERAFEDFFTTKATGTGLGLAFVKRVAEAHGGRATLDSRLGQGTTVTIVLGTGSPRETH